MSMSIYLCFIETNVLQYNFNIYIIYKYKLSNLKDKQ